VFEPLLLVEGDEVSLFVLGAAGVLAGCSGSGDAAPPLSSVSEVLSEGGFSFFSLRMGSGDAFRKLSLDCERGAFISEELQNSHISQKYV
jgi:hypothetical protein